MISFGKLQLSFQQKQTRREPVAWREAPGPPREGKRRSRGIFWQVNFPAFFIPSKQLRSTAHILLSWLCDANLVEQLAICEEAWTTVSNSRLQVVPHFSSGIVERTKRDRAWKSPHARKGDTQRGERKFFHPRLRFARSTIPEGKWGTSRSQEP